MSQIESNANAAYLLKCMVAKSSLIPVNWWKHHRFHTCDACRRHSTWWFLHLLSFCYFFLYVYLWCHMCLCHISCSPTSKASSSRRRVRQNHCAVSMCVRAWKASARFNGRGARQVLSTEILAMLCGFLHCCLSLFVLLLSSRKVQYNLFTFIKRFTHGVNPCTCVNADLLLFRVISYYASHEDGTKYKRGSACRLNSWHLSYIWMTEDMYLDDGLCDHNAASSSQLFTFVSPCHPAAAIH